MKFKALFVFFALQLYIFTALQLAYAEQKLINITEDTLAQDSYRPVAGKGFLVAVKLVDVDTESNTEQPVPNETILLQTNAGTLSGTEIITNIYGEAITWLTTSTTADISHMVTASIKDKPEIVPVTIEVKNIALPQNAPTAEELQEHVKTEVEKIQDMTAEVEVTSNEPWGVPVKKLKVWEKGKLLKVQEFSPKQTVYIRPVPDSSIPAPSTVTDIIAYNPVKNGFVIYSKNTAQESKYPFYTDYIDNQRKLINRKLAYLEEGSAIYKIEDSYDLYIQVGNNWINKEKRQLMYKGIYDKQYERKSVSSNIVINSGIPDSEFSQ